MIASNSARSQSSSAHTRSQKASSAGTVTRSSVAAASATCDTSTTRSRGSGADRLPLLALRAAGDADLARLGLLRDRDAQPQHPCLEGRFDVLGVEVVPEDELTAEHATGTLGGQHLSVLLVLGPLGSHRHHVAL